MGWTSYHATYYKKGTVDRKAECDAYFMEGSNAEFYKVIKSALVGSVYYAAVMNLKRYSDRRDESNHRIIEDIPENKRTVWAVVFLTSVNSKDYFNFAYKDLSEDMGPIADRCPTSILNLLSPTDNKQAIAWRERCQKNNEKKKNPQSLSNLPIGTVIRFTNGEGKFVELLKHPAAFQFKRPFWYCKELGCYMPTTRIPDSYEVISA